MLCAENVFSKTALICSVRAQIGFTVRTAFFVMIAVRTYTFMGFIKGGVVAVLGMHDISVTISVSFFLLSVSA